MKSFLNVVEATIYLGLSKSALYKLTSSNQIPFFKPSGKLIYFKQADLDNWIESGYQETVEEEVKDLFERRCSNGY